MNATLRNEMRPVTRQRFEVIWCPFCDRSRQETRPTPFCDGCGAEFTGGAPIALMDSSPNGAESILHALEAAVEEVNAGGSEQKEPPSSRSTRGNQAKQSQ